MSTGTGSGRSARGRGRTTTLADVARRAGVSIATASFVLSGRGGLRSAGSPRTKERVRAAAEELGYVPNRHAQAMRTGRGGGIVLALSALGDPWGVSLTRQVRATALPHDLSTLVLADERWFEYLQGASADAALITSIDLTPDGPSLTRRLAAGTQTGIVAFTAQMEPEGFDVIASTPFAAMREAYALLRSRHPVVHLLAPHPVPVGEEPPRPRLGSFLDAVREHGDGSPERLVRTTESGDRATYLSALDWLAGLDRPAAVICYTGYQAIALQRAADRIGLRTPEDLEIISIGDVPEESLYFGAISYFGVQDVFSRIAEVVVDRARDRTDRPGTLHTFEWELFPGCTSRDGADVADGDPDAAVPS